VSPDAALLEELAANAWPAATVQYADGWRLRATPGVDRRRSNSVLPPPDPYAGSLAVAEVLNLAADFYGRRGLPLRVQVAPAEHHGRLDEELADRGLAVEAPTLVLRAGAPEVVARCTRPVAAAVSVGELSDAWANAWRVVEDRSDLEAARQLVLAHIGPRTAYAVVAAEGAAVAVGMAVVERGWAGLFCMGTAPGHRRQGHGRAVLGALAQWASAYGAGDLYLQVEAGNAAARQLYADAGFARSHTYHYRSDLSGVGPPGNLRRPPAGLR